MEPNRTEEVTAADAADEIGRHNEKVHCPSNCAVHSEDVVVSKAEREAAFRVLPPDLHLGAALLSVP